MSSGRLSVGARIYVGGVIAAGLAAGGLLVVGGDPRAWRLAPILVLGALGIAATALSVTYQGFLPSRIVHQVGSAFAYALFLLVDPGAVLLVLWGIAAADWGVNRRRALTAVFNMAQLALALTTAVAVRAAILPGYLALDDVDGRTLAGALAALIAFFIVNQALTHGVVSLANRRPFFSFSTVTSSGLLNEALCIVSGLSMAVLWWIRPGLVVLGAGPLVVLVGLLVLLSRREQELEARQKDLASLQTLGLELGAELDAEKLRHSVVRIAAEALQAEGALLATLEPSGEFLNVEAHRGIEPPPPERLPLRRFSDGFFEAGVLRRISDFPAEREMYSELAFLPATGLLCVPLEILGRREGLLVVFHGARRRPFDVDDERRLGTLVRFVEVALSNARLVLNLRQVQEQLLQSEKLSALGMLVSGVAHELNNPLTSVVGFSELLQTSESDPRKRKRLERIASEAERAVRIVRGLLTFARHHKPERVPASLNEILEQVLELRAYHLRVSNIEVERRLDPGLPRVLVDPHQFQQVFMNLVTNAEQALSETDRHGKIVVGTRRMGDHLRVSVSDDGPGIAPDNLQRVFVPFFTTKQPGQGTGLGLSICYGIVQEHGGTISVESRPGGGAAFHVDIPMTVASPQVAAGGARAPVAVGERRAQGRLLVVDDEEAIIELVQDFLGQKGWDVLGAEDGEAALARIREGDFDVLLIDLRMPGMDGKALFDVLRTERPDLARRVIFSTGDAGSESSLKWLSRTENPILSKPYDLDALAEAVFRAAAL
jgi:signal transduction histidine kinase/CheY-like chemotaxis protein